jgi:hypothetical protein
MKPAAADWVRELNEDMAGEIRAARPEGESSDAITRPRHDPTIQPRPGLGN